MMNAVRLSGVHLILTYKCLSECDHCFVWSSPGSKGTMTLDQVERIIRQAHEVPTVTRVYFEGGEPFLFYPLMVRGVRLAKELGLEVGIVSNAYFATDARAADLWLEPLAGLGVSDLSLSTDEHHGDEEGRGMVLRARSSAEGLGIPVSLIEVEGVEGYACGTPVGEDRSGLSFRGRAAEKLAPKAMKRSWRSFDRCPEEPPDIQRVHVDPYGNIMFCQGISLGNAWKTSLASVMAELDPDGHPVIGPLIRGGPAELARARSVRTTKGYADPCHLCYEVRRRLRARRELLEVLTPGQVYGEAP